MNDNERNRHYLVQEMIRLYLQRAWSDSELAEALETDRTNVYKIRTKVLEGQMAIVLETVERGRYRIDRSTFVDNIPLSPTEALALYLGGRRLQQQTRTGQRAIATALEKLAQALHKPLTVNLVRAAQVVLEQEQDPQQTGIMRVLMEAWLNGRRVRIQHRKLHGELRTYIVSPYQIEPAVWGDGLYLIGHSDYHNGLATFKISRIEHATQTTEPYTIPDDFDSHALLQHAWGIWHSQDQRLIPVRLQFTKYVTPRVKETIWHPSQTIQDLDDEGCIWQAEIAEVQEIIPWVRGWGADVEVLEPKVLRNALKREAQALAELYQVVDMKKEFIAHTRNKQGEYHLLVAHLQAAAKMAADFATPLHASGLAHYLGLWHDLGKFHPDFQQYLFDAEKGKREHGPDHKAAGVQVAFEHDLGPITLLLQGHHGGLKNRSDLHRWYEQKKDKTQTALSIAQGVIDFKPTEALSFPDFVKPTAPRSVEFFLRMLFSALVDADFLDTETHFKPEKNEHRGSDVDIDTLWQRFADDQQTILGISRDTLVNRSRKEIYDACLKAATQPPGLFRLTVPTGGGKTRSGIGFALRHAKEYELQRVIVVVPYITITQQTANTYREIFEKPEDDKLVILEHHSSAGEQKNEKDEYDSEVIQQRLAAENWDAPIIVTTTVQLFESLFSNSTSKCRKLHQLAKSVIILDEAQSLPAHLLDPILDALRELCTHYGSTVVLSTATQPAFDTYEPFRVLNAREIVPDPERHFQNLKRVNYEWQIENPLNWDEVADLMRSETQALAICNTKQNALDLLTALNDSDALHLSTLLCGKHREVVIKKVKQRLKAGEPCRLVATQVVEAGVDIDFPLVLRALGPLDSIVQAAGRANREGELKRDGKEIHGRVIIFEPANGGLPRGAYKQATETTRTMINTGPLDLHRTDTMEQYFRSLYQLVDTYDNDGKKIQKKRSELDYPEVANLFKMIEGETVSVVITTYGEEAKQQLVRSILNKLRGGAPPTRSLMRQLQPYTVSMYKDKANQYFNQGLLSPKNPEGIPPGIWEWVGKYDEVRGLLVTDINADVLIV